MDGPTWRGAKGQVADCQAVHQRWLDHVRPLFSRWAARVRSPPPGMTLTINHTTTIQSHVVQRCPTAAAHAIGRRAFALGAGDQALAVPRVVAKPTWHPLVRVVRENGGSKQSCTCLNAEDRMTLHVQRAREERVRRWKKDDATTSRCCSRERASDGGCVVGDAVAHCAMIQYVEDAACPGSSADGEG